MQRREGAAEGGRTRRKEGAEEGGWAPGREGARRREGGGAGPLEDWGCRGGLRGSERGARRPGCGRPVRVRAGPGQALPVTGAKMSMPNVVIPHSPGNNKAQERLLSCPRAVKSVLFSLQ